MCTSHTVYVDLELTIETTIVTHESALDEAISSLLRAISNYSYSRTRGLVGFGIEKSFKSSTNYTQFVSDKVAVLKLCTHNHCLIVHIAHFKIVPTSLAKFLNFQSLTFAGFKIKQDLGELVRDYGIQCRNAFELGPLANHCQVSNLFDLYTMRKISCHSKSSIYCALGKSILDLVWRVPGEIDFDDWDSVTLSEQQIKTASIDSYAGFALGILVVSL